ncbi:MAG: hypothetical protein NDI69_05080 [Bacteriovoracaceae bacterium]|nr:hypothetical protein [Bacteriovoracaceae bacterium]
MKNIVLMIGLLFSLTALADIEYVEDNQAKPTQAEITKNRACFQELITQGCGDPGEDPQQFRSCMSNVYSTLTKDCQTLMSKLYGN